MHRPTDNLRADHEVASAGLRILRAIGTHVRHGGGFPTADVALCLSFLRDFVLAVHLRKEYDVVCPAVAMRADARHSALVGELLRLHEEVAELTGSLALFGDSAALTPAELDGFADTIDALATRLAHLQQLEETELFPVCDAAVPADDQLDWLTQFARLEAERGGREAWTALLCPLAASWS